MLDDWCNKKLAAPLRRLAWRLAGWGVSANAVTFTGLGFGVAAFFLIAAQQFSAGLVALLLNRFCDGLDGALARVVGDSDQGGFLDLNFDFLFYGSLPLAFALAAPEQNALAACLLLCSFIGTGSSFLSFAALVHKTNKSSANQKGTVLPKQKKTFYYLSGLTEGSETIAFFTLCSLLPAYFPPLAYGFAVLCGLTTLTRIVQGYLTFDQNRTPSAIDSKIKAGRKKSDKLN